MTRRLCLLLALVLLPAHADDVLTRRLTSTVVEWRVPDPSMDAVVVHLLAFNDFHGHLATRTRLKDSYDTRLVGGAASLAAWINAYKLSSPRALVLIAGDSFGGSPPESGLLRDEPTMEFLNLIAGEDCPFVKRAPPRTLFVTTRCGVVAALGNHELDRGPEEFERLLYGGAHRDGPVLGHDWKGSRVPFLAANVQRKDGTPFLPAAALVDVGGIKIGVVGAVTSETPFITPPGRVDTLAFLPEVAPINDAVALLRKAGAGAVVLLIHEGLAGPDTPQASALAPEELKGPLAAILAALAPGVDVVISGHTHQFTNLLVRTRSGPPILVTQARSYGTAFTDIELVVDPRAHRVLEKAADVLTTWADEGPGHHPDEQVQKLVASALKAVAPATTRLVGVATKPITREANGSGESTLGDLVADAYRRAASTDFAFVNAGSLREDLPEGPVTVGALYAALPFANTLLRFSLTGEQVRRLLESDWSEGHYAPLSIAGLSYLYNPRLPAGRRVVAVYEATGKDLDPKRRYSVVTTDFLVRGGDHYPVFAEGEEPAPVALDLAAFESYVVTAGDQLAPPALARLTRIGD
jgi:5'-nucleotidase